MKTKSILMTAIACLMVTVNVASADLVQGIIIDFVTIGNPGNPGDTRNDYPNPNSALPYGCGSVGYTYQIGKYEVTNAQWYDFVSAVGEPTGNPSNAYNSSAYWTGDNIPTNEVSWYEAAQFSNYLTSGDKSQGAYKWSGNNSNPGDFEGIDRDSAVSTYGVVYVIPTEDEWYKAAYYGELGRGGVYGYSTYANGTDTRPIPGDDTNYNQDEPYDGPWDVGSGTQEQNGTFDMMGNVFEWNETPIGSNRSGRGGWFNSGDRRLRSSARDDVPPGYGDRGIGFRVASVPEPATLLLLGLGGVGLVRKRRHGYTRLFA